MSYLIAFLVVVMVPGLILVSVLVVICVLALGWLGIIQAFPLLVIVGTGWVALAALVGWPYVIGGLGALAVIGGVVGTLLPKKSVASVLARSADFQQPPEIIWQAITSHEQFMTWRRNLRSITSLPPREGRPRWREVFRMGDKPMPFWVQMEEMVTNEKLVTRVTVGEWPFITIRGDKPQLEPNVAFHGTWTYEISRTSLGSHVRITERQEENNPYLKLYRFALGSGVGHITAVTNYLLDLGRNFGEEVEVVE